MAVSLVDRFLAVEYVARENLQGLAGVCLLLSSKVKAANPINAAKIADYTDGAVTFNQVIVSWLIIIIFNFSIFYILLKLSNFFFFFAFQ